MRKAAVLNFETQTRDILREWLHVVGCDVNVMDAAEVERLSEKIRMMPDKKTYQNKKKLVVKNS